MFHRAGLLIHHGQNLEITGFFFLQNSFSKNEAEIVTINLLFVIWWCFIQVGHMSFSLWVVVYWHNQWKWLFWSHHNLLCECSWKHFNMPCVTLCQANSWCFQIRIRNSADAVKCCNCLCNISIHEREQTLLKESSTTYCCLSGVPAGFFR